MARHYRFWGIFIRPYTSAANTDGHNIYEEAILAGMAFLLSWSFAGVEVILEILRHGLPGRTYFFSIRHKRSATHIRRRYQLTPIALATQSQLRLANTPTINVMKMRGAAFPAEKKAAHIRKSSPLPRALQIIRQSSPATTTNYQAHHICCSGNSFFEHK